MTRERALRVLDVPAASGTAEVRQAYLDLVRVWHPDRFEADARLRTKASCRLAEINVAYRLLVVEQRAGRALPVAPVPGPFAARVRRPTFAPRPEVYAPRPAWGGVAATAAVLFGVACVALALMLTSAVAI